MGDTNRPTYDNSPMKPDGGSASLRHRGLPRAECEERVPRREGEATWFGLLRFARLDAIESGGGTRMGPRAR